MKKIFLIILCILFLQLNNSCKTQFSTVELQNHFTPDEIADLNKITAFFKNQMCIGIDSDFEKCYKKIPHDYLYATGNGFWENINFKEQQNLYNQISKFTFDEIGKKLTLSPSWCHRLYENALANEKTYGKVYDLFWI